MTLRQKILLLATIPLIVAIAVITILVSRQAAELAETEIKVFEKTMLDARKAELLNYIALAQTSIEHLYNLPVTASAEDVIEAQNRAKLILNGLTFGEDGYFFVYDYQGTSVVHPKQTWRVGNGYWNLRDKNDQPVIQNLIEAARAGGGFVRYTWEQPSQGNITDKIGYAVGLDRWGWMLGTGLYIDDVIVQVETAQHEVNTQIRQTFVMISAITLGAVLCVFATGVVINFRESRLADAKLQALAQKVFETQEEERARVARELHDGISQILVSVKYMLDRARAPGHETRAVAIDKAEDNLNLAIAEVRRISHALRPGVLDDLGLSRALENLADEFAARTGIAVDVKTTAFKNLLSVEAKTALYRVAQESLTNIERHSGATKAWVGLFLSRDGFTLEIGDNGRGVDRDRTRGRAHGIGLKNMQERIEHFGGDFAIRSDSKGTVVMARLPRTVLARDEALAAE